MRILYLHQYFNLRSSPGGIRSYEIASRLVQWGHEVEMLTTDRKACPDTQGKWRRTVESGISVHWCSVQYSNSMGFVGRVRAFFDFAVSAFFHARSVQADIVFATSTPLTIAIPAIAVSRLRKIPMVFEVRDLWPQVPIDLGILRNPLVIMLARWLEKAAYNNSMRVIALSPGMKAGIEKRGYPPNRIHLIPNGSDIEFFSVSEGEGGAFRRGLAWLGDRPLVVYTGALGVANGVDYLVRVAAAVRSQNPDLRFLIAGEGAQKAMIREIASSLGILDSIVFIYDPLPKDQMPKILSAATMATSVIIDNPTLWDNSANKFFDALAAGRPVAINHEGWIANLIRENDIGVVLPPKDISLAARKLADTIADRVWLRGAGQRSRNLAQRAFDRNSQVKEVCEVLELSYREYVGSNLT